MSSPGHQSTSARPYLLTAATLMPWLLIPGLALAQTGTVFKCKHADGSAYFSDRSCPSGDQLSGKVDATGSAPSRTDASQYMSARCQRLRAALRRADNQDESYERDRIQQEYQSTCASEEQEANERVYRQSQDERERKLQEQRDAAQAKERHKIEQAQCVELGSIIRSKREHLNTMTSGERAFGQRCQGG